MRIVKAFKYFKLINIYFIFHLIINMYAVVIKINKKSIIFKFSITFSNMATLYTTFIPAILFTHVHQNIFVKALFFSCTNSAFHTCKSYSCDTFLEYVVGDV